MRAVVHTRYGPPERLTIDDVPMPSPQPEEVLVRVAAAAISASDLEMLTGTPLYARIGGLRRPRRSGLGSDLAGVVEAVGSQVDSLSTGDRVLGFVGRLGCFATHVAVPAKDLLRVPGDMALDAASTLAQSGPIAVQGIVTRGGVRAGEHVCVNGAGGGSGLFAIQLAKHHGAEVTAVDNGLKQEFMRSLGADHVVDYESEDVTASGARFDLVLDLAGHRSLLAWRRVLTDGGRYFYVGGTMRHLFQALALTPFTRSPQLRLLAVRLDAEHVQQAVVLSGSGAAPLAPVIDRRFPLEAAVEALRYVGEGRACGKVVIEP